MGHINKFIKAQALSLSLMFYHFFFFYKEELENMLYQASWVINFFGLDCHHVV